MSQEGTIYLVCLKAPGFRHAKHYLGWTKDADPEARLEEHRKGRGSKLLKAVAANGIEFRLARTWMGSRDDERKLKRQKNSCRLCPFCREEALLRKKMLARIRNHKKKETEHGPEAPEAD